MKFLTDNPLGLYVHIPFCAKKCGYCDFYSAVYNEETLIAYLSALKSEIEKWGNIYNRPVDTVYIGGGTPSLLGKHIIALSECINKNFNLTKDCEFTVEINPSSSNGFLDYAKSAGVNRISIGVQSGDDKKLKFLGRTHTVCDAQNTVYTAKKSGFSTISVDLMIALPDSNTDSLKKDADFMLSLKPQHISAYILKIEPRTLFAKKYDTLNLPDDDFTAEQYLYMCEIFEKSGYHHYEISNFAKDNYISRHNMKYWTNGDYLGLGASAHSFVGGKRFYYPRDLHGFIKSPSTVPDGTGGDFAERLMLGLRLSSGVDLSKIYPSIPDTLKRKISAFEKSGYLIADMPNISLTDKGMLVSNSIITELLLED